MSATAELHEVTTETLLASVEQQSSDPADRFARLVVQLVALADASVDPALITPAALILRDEDLIDLPDVTFGCNYELDVRSFELDRGYVRAIDAGWLKLRSGEVRVNSHFASPDMSCGASARARDLFALRRREIVRIARHHLLRASDDQPGRPA